MNKILRPYTYLLSVHVAALLMLSVIRLFFYIAVKEQITGDAAGNASWICAAFLRGLWFDNVIACYITALPLLATSVATALNLWKNRFIRTINIWYAAFYTLVFMAAASNIPYFVYFSKPLNASIWNWAEYGTTTMGMIFGKAPITPTFCSLSLQPSSSFGFSDACARGSLKHHRTLPLAACSRRPASALPPSAF